MWTRCYETRVATCTSSLPYTELCMFGACLSPPPTPSFFFSSLLLAFDNHFPSFLPNSIFSYVNRMWQNEKTSTTKIWWGVKAFCETCLIHQSDLFKQCFDLLGLCFRTSAPLHMAQLSLQSQSDEPALWQEIGPFWFNARASCFICFWLKMSVTVDNCFSDCRWPGRRDQPPSVVTLNEYAVLWYLALSCCDIFPSSSQHGQDQC